MQTQKAGKNCPKDEKILKKVLILWEKRVIMRICMNKFGNRRCNHAQH